MLNRSKIETARERLATLCQWRKWADELNEAELELKQGMEPHVHKVMDCKRLLLLNKLATEVWDGQKILFHLKTHATGSSWQARYQPLEFQDTTQSRRHQ